MLANDARNDVGRAACGERDDQRDLPLRVRGRRRSIERRGGDQQGRSTANGQFHRLSPYYSQFLEQAARAYSIPNALPHRFLSGIHTGVGRKRTGLLPYQYGRRASGSKPDLPARRGVPGAAARIRAGQGP